MPKIGLSLQSNYPANAAFFPLLRDIGFRAVSPFWSSVNDLKDTVDTAAACGLTLQSLHGSYQGLTGMWNRDKALSTPIFQALSNGVEACAAFGINPNAGPPLIFITLPNVFANMHCFRTYDRLLNSNNRSKTP